MFKRKKYDEFRIQCVEAVFEGKDSVKSIAKEKGIEHSNRRLWLGFYETCGKRGLEPRPMQQYTSSFKLSVLKAIDKELLSFRVACVRFI